MCEYEKKIMISLAEYNLIRKMGFGFGAVETQTNYYYDTDDLRYNSNNITLRIREKNGEFVATVKKHYAEPQNYSTEETADCRDENDAGLFKDYDAKLKGKLVTERCVSEPESGIKIMLDRNRYLGKCDHEIEFEYEAGHESSIYFYIEAMARCFVNGGLITAVTDFCDRDANQKSKSQRFFDRLKEHECQSSRQA